MKSQIKSNEEMRKQTLKSLEEAHAALASAARELSLTTIVTPRIEEAAYWCAIQALRLVRTIKFGPRTNSTEREMKR